MIVKNDYWPIVIFLLVVILLVLVLGGLLQERNTEEDESNGAALVLETSDPGNPPDSPSMTSEEQAAVISNLTDQIAKLEDALEEMLEELGAGRDFKVEIGEVIRELDGRLDIVEGIISTHNFEEDRITNLEVNLAKITADNLSMIEHINLLEHILVWGGVGITVIILILLIWLISAHRRIHLLQSEIVAQRSRLAKVAHSQNALQKRSTQSQIEQKWMVAQEVEQING